MCHGLTRYVFIATAHWYFFPKYCLVPIWPVFSREEEIESRNLTYGIRTYSFLPFDFNQGYFNQFEVLESQKWLLVDKTKSFYIESALSFFDFQLLHGQKAVYSLQPLLFLEIITLKFRLCIFFSVIYSTNCYLKEYFKNSYLLSDKCAIISIELFFLDYGTGVVSICSHYDTIVR